MPSCHPHICAQQAIVIDCSCFLFSAIIFLILYLSFLRVARVDMISLSCNWYLCHSHSGHDRKQWVPHFSMTFCTMFLVRTTVKMQLYKDISCNLHGIMSFKRVLIRKNRYWLLHGEQIFFWCLCVTGTHNRHTAPNAIFMDMMSDDGAKSSFLCWHDIFSWWVVSTPSASNNKTMNE